MPAGLQTGRGGCVSPAAAGRRGGLAASERRGSGLVEAQVARYFISTGRWAPERGSKVGEVESRPSRLSGPAAERATCRQTLGSDGVMISLLFLDMIVHQAYQIAFIG